MQQLKKQESESNKLAKLRRHASRVHFAKIHNALRFTIYALRFSLRVTRDLKSESVTNGPTDLQTDGHGYWVGARDTCVSKNGVFSSISSNVALNCFELH